MSEIVSVRMDAQDIVERVDEMLAWLATTYQGENRLVFTADNARRAEPLIKTDKNSWGRLSPSAVEIEDNEEWFSQPAEVRREKSNMVQVMNDYEKVHDSLVGELGERFSHCFMREHSDGEEVTIAADFGDDVSGERIASDGTRYDMEEYGGVRFVASGAYEPQAALAAEYRRILKLPQAAKLLVWQSVTYFRNGKTQSSHWPIVRMNGRFCDKNRMPMRVNFEGKSVLHPVLMEVCDLLCAQIRRREEWTVEVSLTERRTGIGLSTDQLGAREFTNMLRKETTKAGRSKSLVHWVGEHMRRARTEGADPVLVRAHMRGVQLIDAGSRYARIYPSRVDIERACNGKRFDNVAAE